ncbi:LytTR family DNA-binding domain-containing protein [Primorskyibacter sp. S87]|uniref:LytTR family DNA-binding domain-containing protein n=1 Tax=Primorskyibacter sp. S87 TaxID=3415126 RepID=UPI003C7A7B49
MTQASGFLVNRTGQSWHPLAAGALSVAVISLLLSPFCWGVTWAMSEPGPQDDPSLIGVSQYVVVMATGLLTARGFLTERKSPPETAEQPRLLRRLPADFVGPVLRLTVRDHMVEVFGPEHASEIRLKFTDAIAEMEPVEGYCTHRSHWVTREAIAGIERSGSKIHILLSNGDRIPVSRTYKPGLEQAGIL